MQTGLSTLYSGLAGVRRNVAALQREARNIAHAVADGPAADLTGAMVRSIEYRQAAQASATVIRRADQSLGSFINILV